MKFSLLPEGKLGKDSTPWGTTPWKSEGKLGKDTTTCIHSQILKQTQRPKYSIVVIVHNSETTTWNTAIKQVD